MSKEKSDLTLKIFALIIALVLWSNVMEIENPDKTTLFRNISVEYTNIGALEKNRLVIMEPKEFTVSVEVTGTTKDMMDFPKESIKAWVDLSGYKEGQVKVPIFTSLDQMSSKYSISKINPKEILFTFDEIITKDKPVTIRTVGSLDDNYVLGDISTKSKQILLRGPRSYVNEVAEIIAVIDLTGRQETDKLKSVPLRLLDDKGNDVVGVTNEPNLIDIDIPVFRTLTLPIELQTEIPENYEISQVTIKPNRITLKGDKNIVNLTSIPTKPVDIDILMDDIDVAVELDLPSNVTLLNPNEKVTIRLHIVEAFTKTFKYKLEELDIRSLDPNLIIDKDSFTEEIEITLKGSKDIIDNLTKEDLVLYLNLNLYQAGTHRVYIGVDTELDITVKETLPQFVELTIITK